MSRLTSQRTKKFKPLHKPEAATTEEILLSNKASKKYNTAVIRARKVNVPATATTAQIFLQNTDRTTDRAPGHRFIQHCQMFELNVVATYTYPTCVEAKVTTANSGRIQSSPSSAAGVILLSASKVQSTPTKYRAHRRKRSAADVPRRHAPRGLLHASGKVK